MYNYTAVHRVNSAQLITHMYLAVAPDFQFSKCVCKSQNRKCVRNSENTIQNESVSHKIENVSVSHKIVMYRVFLRGADRGVLTMVCNGHNWYLVDYMLINCHGPLSKTEENSHRGIFWLTDISCVTYKHLRNLLQVLIFPLNHAIDKMSVSHANEIWKYIMNFILFQIIDFVFSYSCKSPPFHPKD